MKKTNKKGLALRSANQGFSLVELIIVIAIMAILAAALAPQLMKYIQKSRDSSDNSTAASIKNSVNAALEDDKVFAQCKGKTLTLHVAAKSDFGSTDLEKELANTMGDLEKPKNTDNKSWEIVIKGSADGEFSVTVKAVTTAPTAMTSAATS